jgi:hypothetical protein
MKKKYKFPPNPQEVKRAQSRLRLGIHPVEIMREFIRKGMGKNSAVEIVREAQKNNKLEV